MKSFTEHHHCLYSDFCVCFYFPAGPHDPAWGWKLPFSFPQRKSSGQHCWIHDGKVKNNTREQSMAWPKHRPSTILTIKINASSIKTSQTPVVSWWPRLWGLHMENTPLKIWLVDCFLYPQMIHYFTGHHRPFFARWKSMNGLRCSFIWLSWLKNLHGRSDSTSRMWDFCINACSYWLLFEMLYSVVIAHCGSSNLQQVFLNILPKLLTHRNHWVQVFHFTSVLTGVKLTNKEWVALPQREFQGGTVIGCHLCYK